MLEPFNQNPMTQMNEQQTRARLIDQALTHAGWNLKDPTQVGLEIPVDGTDPLEWARLSQHLSQGGVRPQDVSLPSGIADYLLYRENGEVLAVVEAKKTAVNPQLAEAQGGFYARALGARQSFTPFVFLSNGLDLYFVDVDRAPKRLVSAFFARGDLENLLSQRQNAEPLGLTSINRAIAGRDYQMEAIRRVGEAFEGGRRRALLVMATGTGKTRTAMGLADQYLRSNWGRRVLFVADRDALVEQALEEGFQEHLPGEPASRIYGYAPEDSAGSRLFVCTLQTLSNLLEHFSPAYFDLILFDEVHRSIFNSYKVALDYFDARMVGLTATPAHFVDRNTLLAFECDDKPTYLYGYQEAIEDGVLVDFTLSAAKTRFQRDGIKGVNLSQEELDVLIEAGIDPDEVDYTGGELEKTVSNKDTLRRQWEEIMDSALTDASGLIGKTIVFALSQDHALRLLSTFGELYPQHVGLAEIITYKSNYKGEPLERFKKQNYPRIAISVDLLDTGVNVPEILNLVVMKPVQSRIKLEQMIGRGTRNDAACKYRDRLPEGGKTGFLILDFWENDFDRRVEKAPPPTLAVNIRIFNTRLSQLERLLGRQGEPLTQGIVSRVREQLSTLPLDSFAVKRHLFEIEATFEDAFWSHLTPDKLSFLRGKVGPLLRFVPTDDVEAQTFTGKLEGLKLEKLGGKKSAQLESIVEDVARIPESILESDEDRELRNVVLMPSFEQATPETLDRVREGLSKYMNRRTDRLKSFLELDLRDFIAERSHIVLDEAQQPLYAEAYREAVNREVTAKVMAHPAAKSLLSGENTDTVAFDLALLDLERTLRRDLGKSYLNLDERNIRRAYQWKVGSLLEFVARVLELPGLPDYKKVVERQFESFIAAHPFTGQQTRFVKTLRSVLLERKRLEASDLYDAPAIVALGEGALEAWFTPEQRTVLLEFGQGLSVSAQSGAVS